MQRAKYDTEKYMFRKLVMGIIQEDNLEKIHENYEYPSGQCTMEDNSNSLYHRRFYDKLRSGWDEFINIYDLFVNKVVASMMDEEFIYQATPTLRVHLVNNWATPEFHCDTDAGYNHPEGEVNFFLPLTRCYDTNSVWMESEPGKGDFEPVKIKSGEVLKWDGNKCRHGNKINTTDTTRVSFDFRVLPKKKYKPETFNRSETMGTKFEIGFYYKELIGINQ